MTLQKSRVFLAFEKRKNVFSNYGPQYHSLLRGWHSTMLYSYAICADTIIFMSMFAKIRDLIQIDRADSI